MGDPARHLANGVKPLRTGQRVLSYLSIGQVVHDGHEQSLPVYFGVTDR